MLRRILPWVVAGLTLACGADSDSESSEPPSPEPLTDDGQMGADAPGPALTLETAPLTPDELGDRCTDDPAARGSLHAETMYQVPLEDPSGGKARQGFRCGEAAIAVLFYDYGTPARAHAASGWVAAQLYGPSRAPSPRNPDELLRAGSVLAVVSSRQPGAMVDLLRDRRGFRPARELSAPPAELPSSDITDGELARLRTRIDCEARAAYCEAVDAFRTGTPTALPTAPRSRLGRALLPGQRESIVYAVLSPRGITDGAVTPDSEAEAAQLQDMLEVLRAGEAPAAEHPVAAFVAGLASSPPELLETSVLGRSRSFATADRRAYFRSLPDGGLVAIDADTTGLVRVSVYRD